MPIDDLLREQSCESQPVYMCIAEEPVVRILGEIFLEASIFLLHIHAPVAEHVAQDIGEQLHESDSLLLFTATLFQERTDCIRHNQVAAFAAMSGHGAERVAGLK